MAQSRLRRWGKRLAYLAGFGVCLVVVLWAVALVLSERAAPFSGTPVPTQVGVAPDEQYAPAVAKAREHSQALMAECQVPGLSVAIAVDGRVVWSEGFGYADRDKKTLVTPRTKFRVASVSKCFTAAAVIRLYEQRRLDLDAPIQSYVPNFPEKGHAITARQLLTHRAGIRAYRDDSEALNTKHYRTVTDSLEKFKDDPLVFPPDTDFRYSNYGYVLLSAAVEGASGEDYLSAMRRLVFEPLGMRDTIENRPHERVADQTSFYDHEIPYSPDGSVVESPFIDFSCKWASGGFLSTAEDLARFGSAHLAPVNDGYLRADTLDLMFTPRSSQAGIIGYGMGWMTARDLHLRRARFHFGAGSGGTSVLAIYPGDRTCVAIVGNLGHAKFGYNRLAGVSNPFLSDPAVYVLSGFVGLIVIGLALAVRRRLRGRRAVVA